MLCRVERNLQARLTYRRKQMARMTEEEADALDEEITCADITLKPGEGGIFTRQREMLNVLDKAVADYILTRAEASRQTPAQIIGELVKKEIAVSVET
jgi:hypothetical protein